MTIDIFQILLFVGGLVLGGVGYFLVQKYVFLQTKSSAKKELQKAENEKKRMVEATHKEMEKIKKDFHHEKKNIQNELLKKEKKIIEKEEKIDKEIEKIDVKKLEFERKIQETQRKIEEAEIVKQKQIEEIENIAKLSKEEAKELLFAKIETEESDTLLEHIKKTQKDIHSDARQKANECIVEAMQRLASEVASESTVTIVELPNDEMKGRIIGKEGRNIQSFEKVTGVDVIIDDAPGAVTLSGFDLMRRYIAKMTLQKLVEDGRIHPTHIEQFFDKATKDTQKYIKEVGNKVILDMGITGMHPEIMSLLGTLKFRTFYGQNVLKHSVEVANIASFLSEQMGLSNKDVVQKGALLHSIGKATDHTGAGSYIEAGVNIAKKYNLSKEVQDIIQTHDEVKPCKTIEAKIVAIARNIALSRPGSKKEGLETLIKRLKNLEAMAMSMSGVKKAFAMQAGKELRVVIDAETTNDLKAYKLAKRIAKEIEKTMDYVGQIKVTVTRETHVMEYAK